MRTHFFALGLARVAHQMASPKEQNRNESLAVEVEESVELRGKGVREVLHAIPRIRLLVIGAAIRGLAARKPYWDKELEDWVWEPDYMAQAKAYTFLAAYGDGLPVQATVNLNVSDDRKKAQLTFGEAMRHSPALVDAVEKELRRIRQPAMAEVLEQ